MAEYIEREAAINGIIKIIRKSDMPEDWSKGMAAAMSTLYRIPAADVRPVVRGKWAEKNDDVCYWFECSVCGQRPPWNEWGTEWQSPFCPNCGADMKE